MIIDCHTHAWEHWPYEPQVPNPESHGRVEKLLWEMDRNGVDHAVLVCANLDHNPRNNEYGAESAKRYPDRITCFADVDCSWSPTYHTPGAAARLAETADRLELKGFTHYLADDYDWLESEEGLAFFGTAAERGLIASLAFGAPWHPHVRKLARRFPELVILGHHMAGTRASEKPPYPNFEEVLKSAEVPNIHLKLSGFAYVSQVDWEYPYSDTMWMVRKLYERYGPERLCWASDFPPVLWYMTYQQSLEAVRTHCDFIPEADQGLILGGNMEGLLGL